MILIAKSYKVTKNHDWSAFSTTMSDRDTRHSPQTCILARGELKRNYGISE